jgi:pimeloyl-ACP methyl ester carboxylesterase
LNDPEVFRLEVDPGESITLDWYPADPRVPVALFIHGLGSHRRGEKTCYFAQRFNAVGRSVAAIDMRGHGDSDGATRDLTMSRLLADVSAAAAWTAARSGQRRTLLIGASIGASVAAWHAVRQPATTEALILIAPSLRFPSTFAHTLGREAIERWRRTGIRRFHNDWIDLEIGYGLVADAVRYDPAELRRQLASPLLLIHGMQDETIPWQQSADFVRNYPRMLADLFLLGDGDHRLTECKELLCDVFCAWLDRRTQAPRPADRAHARDAEP